MKQGQRGQHTENPPSVPGFNLIGQNEFVDNAGPRHSGFPVIFRRPDGHLERLVGIGLQFNFSIELFTKIADHFHGSQTESPPGHGEREGEHQDPPNQENSVSFNLRDTPVFRHAGIPVCRAPEGIADGTVKTGQRVCPFPHLGF